MVAMTTLQLHIAFVRAKIVNRLAAVAEPEDGVACIRADVAE